MIKSGKSPFLRVKYKKGNFGIAQVTNHVFSTQQKYSDQSQISTSFAIVQFLGSAKFVLSGDPLYLQIYSRFNWDNLSISSTFRMCINTNQCNWKDYISWFSTAILQQHWLLLVDPISSWELHQTSVFKFWCEMQVNHSYYFCLYLFFQ